MRRKCSRLTNGNIKNSLTNFCKIVDLCNLPHVINLCYVMDIQGSIEMCTQSIFFHVLQNNIQLTAQIFIAIKCFRIIYKMACDNKKCTFSL